MSKTTAMVKKLYMRVINYQDEYRKNLLQETQCVREKLVNEAQKTDSQESRDRSVTKQKIHFLSITNIQTNSCTEIHCNIEILFCLWG